MNVMLMRSLASRQSEMLKDCDWVVTKAIDQNAQDSLGIQIPVVWVTYRQAPPEPPQAEPGPPPPQAPEAATGAPSRGLGDTVAKVLEATGVARVVKAVAGENCGCKKRQEALNRLVPYSESK